MNIGQDVNIPLGAFEQYFREVNAIPRLLDEEEAQLLSALEQGKRHSDSCVLVLAQQARERLVEGYQPLVIGLARRYARLCRELELLDLIQEGNLGLMQAIEQYDRRVETASFQTWAFSWVRGAVSAAAWRFEGAIHLPSDIAQSIRRMETAHAHLLMHLRREPTITEMSHELRMAEKAVRELIVLREQHVVHLNEISDKDGDCLLEETIADTADVRDVDDELIQRIEEAVSSLSEHERNVIHLRYGFADGQARTQKEVASLLGMKHSAVAAIDRRAQTRLRKALSA